MCRHRTLLIPGATTPSHHRHSHMLLITPSRTNAPHSSLQCRSPNFACFQHNSVHLLTPFRINTCKSVSKQRTLTPFRINTYIKPRGRWLLRGACSCRKCSSVTTVKFVGYYCQTMSRLIVVNTRE